MMMVAGPAQLCPAAGDQPAAYWSCDGHAAALVGAGTRESRAENGLLFAPGVSGQALSVGSPDGRDPRSVYTDVHDLLDPHLGSVCFWVQPVDWHGGDPPFHILLRAMAGDTYFLVYKYFNSDDLLFLFGRFEQWTTARADIADWGPGQWHHIACTWNDNEITLWTDGHRRALERVRYPLAEVEFATLIIGPGGWGERQRGTSLIEELRLYRTVLSRAEIEQQYLAGAAAAGVVQDGGLLTVGRCAPQVDGRVEAEEYVCCTTGLLTTNMVLARRQGLCCWGYDAQRLYVGVSGPAAGAERTELYLAPSAAGPRYQFTFTSDGRAAVTRDGAAYSFPELATRSMRADELWTVEAALPWAAFGLSAPPEGQTWRGNLARTYRDPQQWTSLAPTVGGPHDWSHFLNLRFGADAPAVHITSLVEVAARQWQPRVSARAGAADQVTGMLLTSTERQYGDRSQVFTLWQDGQSTPHAPPPVALSGARSYLLALTWRTAAGAQPLYRRSFNYDPGDPLQVLCAYTLLDSGQLQVTARGRGEGAVRVRFFRPDGALALERTAPVPSDSVFFTARLPLDWALLPPGDYLLRVDHLAADGTASGNFEQEYRVPHPHDPRFAPYVDPQATEVPAPWTPLHSEASAVEMWGRRYDFAGGCLVSSLRSQGQELLAAPVRLRLNGQELAATSAPQVHRGRTSALSAEWDLRTDYGVLAVTSHLTVHFDGYCEVALTVAPPPGPALPVQSLALEFPFRDQVIRLVRDPFVYYGSKSGAVGESWEQTLVDLPMLWVGKEDVGFNWVASDLSQWHFRQPERNVQIQRAAGQAVLRLNLVDSPLPLAQPRRFDFGFVVTPSRPLDPHLRRYRTDQQWQMWCQPWRYFNYPDADQVDQSRVEQAAAGYDSTFLYLSHNFISPFCPEWPYWEQQWRFLGRPYGEYTGDGDAPPALRNYSCYAEACLGSDSFRNFHLHQLQALLQRAPIDPRVRNYYFDFSYGAGCSNPHHGCSQWTDANGRSHRRLLNAATREVTLATYRMIKRSDPKAVISCHIGFPRNLPVQHFSEVMVIGEGMEPQIATQGSYYDLLTPETFRATYLSETWGMKVVFINQLLRAPYIFRPERFAAYRIDDPETRRALLHLLGYLMVHDVDGWWPYLNRYRPVIEQLWAAQDALGWDEEVTFHPYWHQDRGVTVASPQSPRLLASAYARRGKLLLAVLNDTDQMQAVTVQLDLARLGVAAGLRGHDVWEPQLTYQLGPQWQDTIPPRGFRLVLWGD